MDKHKICIITSQQCSHCLNMRLPTLSRTNPSTGPIAGNTWSYDFFKMLLFGLDKVEELDENDEPHFEVYNIHTSTMRSPTIDTSNITQFVWTGEKDNPIKVVEVEGKVPSAIFNYAKAYPTFAYFDPVTWDEDLKSGSNYLYGVVNMTKTIFSKKVNGRDTYEADRNMPFNKKPHQLAKKVREEGLPKPPIGVEDSSIAPGLDTIQRLKSDMYKSATSKTQLLGQTISNEDMVITL